MKNVFLIIFILMISVVSAQDFNELALEIDSILRSYNTVGASFFLFDSEQGHEFQYGMRDMERNLPVNSETKYRIASVSKLITALSAMILVEDGLLDLEEDISTYLGFQIRNPNFASTEIKLKYLMTHLSSLRDSDAYSSFLSATYSMNPPSIFDLLSPEGDYYQPNIWSSYHEPGSNDGWDYSNLSAGVLATIIEIVSNQHFHQFTRTNIFEPLGLDCCWNDFSSISDINDIAVIYRNNGQVIPQIDNFLGQIPQELDFDELPIGYNGLIFSPQGGLRISSNDLGILMNEFLNNFDESNIISDETLSLMETTHWSGYGMGGFFNEMGLQIHKTYDIFQNELFFGHAGEAYGLVSDFYYNRTRNIGLILIINGAHYGYGNTFYNIEEEIFDSIQNWFDTTDTFSCTTEPMIKIFPTIVTNCFLNIESDKIIIDKIEIFNVKGQKVKSKNTKSKNSQLNLSDLPTGIYFTKISSGKTRIKKKFVILK